MAYRHSGLGPGIQYMQNRYISGAFLDSGAKPGMTVCHRLFLRVKLDSIFLIPNSLDFNICRMAIKKETPVNPYVSGLREFACDSVGIRTLDPRLRRALL